MSALLELVPQSSDWNGGDASEVGTDGLTRRERAEYAQRYYAGPGAPPTRQELEDMQAWLDRRRGRA